MRISALPACVILLVFAGCTTREKLSSSIAFGGYAVIDSSRALVTLDEKAVYSVDGFWAEKEVTETERRFFLLNFDSAGTIKPMSARINRGGGLLARDGDEVILDPRFAFDFKADRIVRTGFDEQQIPKPDTTRLYPHAWLEPGPAPGRNLVRADFQAAEPYYDRSYRQWFLFDRATRRFTLLDANADGVLLAVTYAHGGPWGLYKVDSVSVSHRLLGSAGPGRIISLPDTLTEEDITRYRVAEIHYIRGQIGIFLHFKCGICPEEEENALFRLDGDSTAWKYFPRESLDREVNWLWARASGKKMMIHRGDRPDQPAAFDFKRHWR